MSKTGIPAISGGGSGSGGLDLGIPPRTLLTNKFAHVPYTLSNLAQSTAALTDSQLWLLPLPVFTGCTLQELHGRTDTTAGSAGAVARMGIYPFVAGASPLFDSGPIATTNPSTTFVSACNLVLAQGWYLAAFVAQGNPVTKPTTRVGVGWQSILANEVENYFANDAGVWAYTMSGVSGALPALSGLTAVTQNAAIAPIIGLKFA